MGAAFNAWQADFAQHDSNKNGYIDGGELKQMIEKQLGKKISYPEFQEFMQTVECDPQPKQPC